MMKTPSKYLMLSVFAGFLLCCYWMVGCSTKVPTAQLEAYNDLPAELDFNIHVKPILSDKCYLCHGPDKANQKGGLRLDIAETAYAKYNEETGRVAIKPGDLEASEVFHRIVSEDKDYVMPTKESNLNLTDREKAILIKWIEDGAEYRPHWAFISPKKPALPEVKHKDWVKNPIDQFVVKKLEIDGYNPSEEADKATLLRRLSLDLTGLPPTPEEINNFLEDRSENAYEKQVDRLLNSNHYGEQMAAGWMDLARYADTHGYQVDRYRDVSPWRDWVIKSYNENMPFDQFVEWQLAGDLLPNPTKEQLLATAFNRLHPQNLEGGIVDEEFRVEYVADRASTVGKGLMGLTVACARCHDHKYDPISQKNFYELYSFFNNVNETGQISWDMAMPVPTMLLPNKIQEEVISYLQKVAKEDESKLAETVTAHKNEAQDWVSHFGYQKLGKLPAEKNKEGEYLLDGNLKNKVGNRKSGKMDRQFSAKEEPTFSKGYNQMGLRMDGDAWLDLEKVGVFKRKDPFSIGIWVNLPDSLKEGVIFHKNKGTRLHSYKGYHLYLKDNKLELMLAHTWPDNAIVKLSADTVERNKWIHLMMTYDGSSKASGLKLYMNGTEVATQTETDNLYKDIIFFDYRDQIYKDAIEPGLQIGARWRGVGIKGASVDNISVYRRTLTALEVKALVNPEYLTELCRTKPDALTATQKELLTQHYLTTQVPEIQKAKQTLLASRTVLFDSIEPVQEMMVMKEMEERRPSYILERGNYDAHGEEVFPDVPSSILAWNDSLPKNRLGLAKWLMNPQHPLTSRVTVNRYWQQFFGKGLVDTADDFGNQGSLPSHPELLDWLAISFIESGWDIKQTVKQIVMSATYRQSSKASKTLREQDPNNILLARGPSLRLSSEMMRDNALLASGLLNDTIGGESVRTYQPEGLWAMNSAKYVQDTGDKLYRRSLYTIWKRTVPNPTLATFDQPERTECTVTRQKTNTPLQALVLLNDPTYLEAAKVIGESITREGSTEQSIKNAYRRLTGKQPSAAEMTVLVEMSQKEYEQFRNDPKKAKGWLEAGEYKIDQALDLNRVAANAIVASVMMNSDASITKR
ncbi:DUF1553 domain-containing protein [Limibacter armeniacum]|uniref:DUF1553 domain-containing protein n=1 Tax=Limibacter armeniacum TaxID=466084 RepID=UPI002FE698F9